MKIRVAGDQVICGFCVTSEISGGVAIGLWTLTE